MPGHPAFQISSARNLPGRNLSRNEGGLTFLGDPGGEPSPAPPGCTPHEDARFEAARCLTGCNPHADGRSSASQDATLTRMGGPGRPIPVRVASCEGPWPRPDRPPGFPDFVSQSSPPRGARARALPFTASPAGAATPARDRPARRRCAEPRSIGRSSARPPGAREAAGTRGRGSPSRTYMLVKSFRLGQGRSVCCPSGSQKC